MSTTNAVSTTYTEDNTNQFNYIIKGKGISSRALHCNQPFTGLYAFNLYQDLLHRNIDKIILTQNKFFINKKVLNITVKDVSFMLTLSENKRFFIDNTHNIPKVIINNNLLDKTSTTDYIKNLLHNEIIELLELCIPPTPTPTCTCFTVIVKPEYPLIIKPEYPLIVKPEYPLISLEFLFFENCSTISTISIDSYNTHSCEEASQLKNQSRLQPTVAGLIASLKRLPLFRLF